MRCGLLMALVALLFGALVVKLVYEQVLNDEYRELADRQGIVKRLIEADRGAILDRNFSLLAVSDDRPTIWADPREVIDPIGDAAQLSEVLGLDAARLAHRLRPGTDRHFVYVARQVSPAEAEAVQALALDGIGIVGEPTRLRPNGNRLARGVLGAVDIDQNPLGGVEKQFDGLLQGVDGRRVAHIARSGMALPEGIEESESRSVRDGDDIVLTLHAQTQWKTEQVLLDAVTRTGAKGGSAVVMESASGDLLALAGIVRDEETGEIAVAAYNPAYTHAFEPGSVAKSFALATAIETGHTSKDELHEALPITYQFADKEFVEPFRTEERDFTTQDILTHSSNVGTIRIAQRLSRHLLHEYLAAFGFGALTGPDDSRALPGESRGILRPASQWQGTDMATIAFGQGISVTAVQLAAAYNVFANDGVYRRPRLLRGTLSADGSYTPMALSPPRRVISSQTAADMNAMLASVVTDGTGKRAAVPGVAVAGKTGTAQKADAAGGYSSWAYTSNFAGFLPADAPELTVVVVLDQPVEYLAGAVAAPVFSEIAEYALRVLRVAPDA